MQRNTLGLELFAEFIGTAILLFLGAGSVVCYVILKTVPSYWEMALLWGMAVTFAIYVAGGVSGCHINPAVTLAVALFGGFPWKKVVPYIVAQVVGAFAGAAAAYLLFAKQIVEYEAANGIVRNTLAGRGSAGIFTTFPGAGVTFGHAILVEIFITFLLVFVIFAVTDTKNPAMPSGGLGAVIIGLTVAVIGGSFGPLTGFALNPARDFGPKLFCAMAGWGATAFPANGYFIVPIIAPIIGGILGAACYKYLVGSFFAAAE